MICQVKFIEHRNKEKKKQNMKEIKEELFGVLYDKLSEHLMKNGGVMETVGIEKGETSKTLTEMWQGGKKWETVTLIIAYHYSRTDSLLLHLSNSKTLINRGTSFPQIQKLLGIKKGKLKCEEIGRDEFEEEFGNLWGIFRGQKKIGTLLKGLGIEDGALLESYWKQGYQWETITAIIVSMRMKTSGEVSVDTEYGSYRFTNPTYYQIFETIISKA